MSRNDFRGFVLLVAFATACSTVADGPIDTGLGTGMIPPDENNGVRVFCENHNAGGWSVGDGADDTTGGVPEPGEDANY